MAEASDLTPQEWLGRLGPKLLARQPEIAYWRRYYEGNHDLPAGPHQNREAYKRFQKLARTNLCLLCAESMVHRMQVIGYRDGARPVDDVLRLWQASKLDARQTAVYRKAFARSAAYVIVGPDPRDPARPRVTIEGPETVIVETDPADPIRRLAALRLWHDPIARRWMATIYLPGERHHWQSRAEVKDPLPDSLNFAPESWVQRTAPIRSLPQVPVVPFVNAEEGEMPRAAFDVGIDVQNRLNLTLLNRLTSERYAAFRQTVLLNYEIEEDPVTGEPVSPYNPGADQVVVVPPPEPGDPPTTIQSLPQTDTSQMLRGVESDMRAFAAVTLTPVYYLPGDLINIGADSIAALDAGHVAKVRQQMAGMGEQWEEVIQLMADVAGLARDLSQGEVVWARPENFNPAQVADYAVKLKTAGVPLPMVAEEIGWSPQRVRQLRTELAADALRQSLTAPAAPRPAQPAAATTTPPES